MGVDVAVEVGTVLVELVVVVVGPVVGVAV